MTEPKALETVTLADFLSETNQEFHIEIPGRGEVAFTLAEVTPSGIPLPDPAIPAGDSGGDGRMPRQSFSLLFSGPQDLHLPQGTYTVCRKARGFRAQLFLVPIKGAYAEADKAPRIYMQAVFN